MKKVILFLWFGDEKPPYIQWSLENFRKMNPGWEIRYIEYSTQQILHYKEQNDPILIEAVEEGNPKRHFSYIVDSYKWKYLCKHPEEFIIYCDLDCFPIAPFDNFIITKDMGFPSSTIDVYCKNKHKVYDFGIFARASGNKVILGSDSWAKCNNSQFAFNRVIQIHNKLSTNENITVHEGIILNNSKIPDLCQRSMDFHNMKIELGDNFCLPQFTPIEHYYSRERNKLNKGDFNI